MRKDRQFLVRITLTNYFNQLSQDIDLNIFIYLLNPNRNRFTSYAGARVMDEPTEDTVVESLDQGMVEESAEKRESRKFFKHRQELDRKEFDLPNGSIVDVVDIAGSNKRGTLAYVLSILLLVNFIYSTLVFANEVTDPVALVVGILGCAAVLIPIPFIMVSNRVRRDKYGSALALFAASSVLLFGYSSWGLLGFTDYLNLPYVEYFLLLLNIMVIAAILAGTSSILRAEAPDRLLASRIILILAYVIMAIGMFHIFMEDVRSASPPSWECFESLLAGLTFIIIALALLGMKQKEIVRYRQESHRDKIIFNKSHGKKSGLVITAGLLLLMGACIYFLIGLLYIVANIGTNSTEMNEIVASTLLPSLFTMGLATYAIARKPRSGPASDAVKCISLLLISLSLYCLFSIPYIIAEGSMTDILFNRILTTFVPYLGIALPGLPDIIVVSVGIVMGIILLLSTGLIKNNPKSVRKIGLVAIVPLALMVCQPLILSNTFSTDLNWAPFELARYTMTLSVIVLIIAIVAKCDYRLIVAECGIANYGETEEVQEEVILDNTDSKPNFPLHYCPTCGFEFEGRLTHCPSCGHDISAGIYTTDSDNGNRVTVLVHAPRRVKMTDSGFGSMSFRLGSLEYECNLGDTLHLKYTAGTVPVQFIQKNMGEDKTISYDPKGLLSITDSLEIFIEYDKSRDDYVIRTSTGQTITGSSVKNTVPPSNARA